MPANYYNRGIVDKMKVEEKLKKSGYTLPETRRPEGVYTLVKRVGNLLYIAGQTSDFIRHKNRTRRSGLCKTVCTNHWFCALY